ncbi:unnamed protein product [Agarophyton chilense]
MPKQVAIPQPIYLRRTSSVLPSEPVKLLLNTQRPAKGLPFSLGTIPGSTGFSLPDSSTMVFVEAQPKHTASKTKPGAQVFKVNHILESEGYIYEHDIDPYPNYPACRALSWLSVSETLHKPVDVEAVESKNRGDAREE